MKTITLGVTNRASLNRSAPATPWECECQNLAAGPLDLLRAFPDIVNMPLSSGGNAFGRICAENAAHPPAIPIDGPLSRLLQSNWGIQVSAEHSDPGYSR
jgi:hypothetical protein